MARDIRSITVRMLKEALEEWGDDDAPVYVEQTPVVGLNVDGDEFVLFTEE